MFVMSGIVSPAIVGIGVPIVASFMPLVLVLVPTPTAAGLSGPTPGTEVSMAPRRGGNALRYHLNNRSISEKALTMTVQ